jgi:hypothetical protein
VKPSFTGRVGDFDFLVGRWRVHNRILRHRLVQSAEWDDIESDYQAWSHLGGALSVDEFRFLDAGTMACAVRTLDVARDRWSIYWVTSTEGVLGEPVYGGWNGDRGEFHGNDVDDGQPVIARFIWRRVGPGEAHWEQAFRLPERDEWETNWTMEFKRIEER